MPRYFSSPYCQSPGRVNPLLQLQPVLRLSDPFAPPCSWSSRAHVLRPTEVLRVSATGPSDGARPELDSLSHPSNLFHLLVNDIPSYPVCHSGNFQIFVLFLLITTQVPSAVISWPTPIKLHCSVLACLSDTAAPKNSWMACHHIGQWKHRICVVCKIHYEHSVRWRGPSKRESTSGVAETELIWLPEERRLLSYCRAVATENTQ